jgi:N-acetylmuramoyl-L-alanine amidase
MFAALAGRAGHAYLLPAADMRGHSMIWRAASGLLAAGLVAAAAGDAASAASPVVTPAAVTTANPGPTRALVAATDARVVGDKDRTRFILDLSDSVRPVVFPLADPYRLVMDLPEVRFALPPGNGQAARGLVSAFRYGLFSPGKSRIVIDLTSPVAVERVYVTEAGQGQPARLVIEMVPTTRQQFLAAAAAYRDTAVAAAAQRADRVFDLAPRSGTRQVVVIDPGHGGIDVGAVGATGTQEKTVALAFAKVLADRLKATGRYDVYLTRTDDTFLALRDRVTFAQSRDADLLISIHANSYTSNVVRGAAVYTLCEQMCDADASRMALSENRSDILAGIDVAAADSDEVRSILTDLTRRETLNFAHVFALNLVNELKLAATGLFKEPHQEANFKVLTAADVPSALVELGFLSNAADEKLLMSSEWQTATAHAMVRAVGDYFAARLAPDAGKAEIVAQSPR